MIDCTRHAVLIEGSPLSGKGSLAEFLAKKFGHLNVDSGDILRGDITTKHQTASGDLFDDHKVIDAVFNFLPITIPNRLSFTGIPRTAEQFRMIKELLVGDHFRVSVILLGFKESLWQQRLAQRILEAKEKGEEPRPDDDEKTVQKRLAKYKEYSAIVRPLLCAAGWKFCIIDGTKPKDTVRKEAENFVLKELMEMGLNRRDVYNNKAQEIAYSTEDEFGGALQGVLD